LPELFDSSNPVKLYYANLLRRFEPNPDTGVTEEKRRRKERRRRKIINRYTEKEAARKKEE
jgi:hypothetical protein